MADKVLHVAGGYILTTIAGPAPALVLSVAKELWDSACQCGDPEMADIGASIIGIILALMT